MSLHPQSPNQIPPDTFRVAVAAFPKGNIYMRIITAAAINLVRVWEWWTEAYTFGTRSSRFATLAS